MFRTDGLSEGEIWALGQEAVAQAQGKTLYGRGVLLAADVAAAELRVEPDEPPLRHANITGWPPEKDAQLAAAQELAARASLRLRDDA
ncbi:MAG: hypothetical protein HYY06_16540 [Deltaproteobacteria bacterium]|nr:hypothetical protein [Deltaproteobacteria bacterium]